MSVDIKLLEGLCFTVGREGHVYIESPTVSKQHAEIRIINGRIYLRDLNSTNGIYLWKNGRLVYFEEGYVSPLQKILLGDHRCMVQDLLAIVSSFPVFDDAVTQVSHVNKPISRLG